MAATSTLAAARWLAEALETGNPLGPLPADIAPRDLDQAAEVAAATLDALAIAPCGLRLLRRAGSGGGGARPAVPGAGSQCLSLVRTGGRPGRDASR